jgi:hypothetical protein
VAAAKRLISVFYGGFLLRSPDKADFVRLSSRKGVIVVTGGAAQ